MKKIMFCLVFLSMGLFSSCVTQNVTSDNQKMKKVESSSHAEHSYSSTSEFKEIVTDPITMERCDKKVALSDGGMFFCSPESMAKYKEQKN